jgi:hypothetical protein
VISTPDSVYRVLVRLYPADFRRHHGDDLAQLFADLVERDGASAAWRRTVIDLVVTVPRYRLETIMSTRRTTTTLVGTIALLTAGFRRPTSPG